MLKLRMTVHEDCPRSGAFDLGVFEKGFSNLLNNAIVVYLGKKASHQYLELQVEADGELLQSRNGNVVPQLPVAAPRCEVCHFSPQTEPRGCKTQVTYCSEVFPQQKLKPFEERSLPNCPNHEQGFYAFLGDNFTPENVPVLEEAHSKVQDLLQLNATDCSSIAGFLPPALGGSQAGHQL